MLAINLNERGIIKKGGDKVKKTKRASDLTSDIIASIIAEVSRHFEVVLKDKQVEAIETFVNGSDVFVALPTGYGKSLIYGFLPSQEFCLFVTHTSFL